jgi:hypothetical protein
MADLSEPSHSVSLLVSSSIPTNSLCGTKALLRDVLIAESGVVEEFDDSQVGKCVCKEDSSVYIDFL